MTSRITTYHTLPIIFSHGQGCYLFDTEGERYLDAHSGVAVCILGHAHPNITKVIQEQAAKLIHCSNLYQNDWQEKLAEKLCLLTGLEQIFFANSGAEANETALKCIRRYAHKRGFEQGKIIVMDGAFHGRTLATLSASGSRRVQAGFEPLISGFLRVPYNNIDAIKNIANHHDDIVAVMVEPVQGENGVIVPSDNYLKEIRALCDQHQWLMVLDEVQTGVSRTGKLYAFQHEANLTPDILTTSKGLANGIPIGACLMKGPACNLLLPGNHGSTFGGNPLACRVAYTVLETIENEGLCKHVMRMGKMFLDALHKLKHESIIHIRGKGLMAGIEINKPCRDLLSIGLKHKILFNIAAEKTIRLLPPSIIKEHEIYEIANRLQKCFDDWKS